MYEGFIDFVINILKPIKDVLFLLSPNLAKVIGVCIVFLIALAVKRGVAH